MKIAFDVGGVLSKYPDVFRSLINALLKTEIEVHVISDMHPKEQIIKVLSENGFSIPESHIHSADYGTHGENCKAVICQDLGIDVLVDDFIGYLASGSHVRLLVMPQPDEDYYHEKWATDGSEGNFGRRRKKN